VTSTLGSSPQVASPATSFRSQERPGPGAGRRWLIRLLPWVTTAALLAIEELLARTSVLPEQVPPVSKIAQALVKLVPTRAFLDSLVATLEQFVYGLLLGAVVGVVIGVAVGAIPLLYRLTHYVLDFLRFIPSVVYLPVLILVMGGTPRTSYLVAAAGAVWPMLYQTYYGIAGITPVLKDTGRVFGLKPHQRLLHIVLPTVSPFAATGLRIAASHALVVVVAVEIIAGVKGLGKDISVYATAGVYPQMYAVIVVVGVIGVLVNLLLQRLEGRLLHWHTSYREKQA
jgi:ABC-type nitrate/sulfonate/bicarbonate transport system permease component